MHKATLVIAVLSASLMLALPALAATPPYAKVDHYRFVIMGYADQLIFESDMEVNDGGTASSWSESNAEPKLVHQALFIQTPHASPVEVEKAMAAKLQGQKPVSFRSASLHGVKFFVYCPEARWIHFRLYITPAYETTERYLGTIDVDP
jgi:hypothetical protein